MWRASEDTQTDRELFIPIPDHITTMVQAGKLEALLTQHPKQSLVKFVVNGFREDFDIGYRGNLSPGATSNLRLATLHHGNVSKEGTRSGSYLRSFQITTNYSNINVPCGQYQKYLESLDGGRRELQSEKQSASEVFRIYQSLPNATTAKLCVPLYVCKHFIDTDTVEKKYKADTIKHYIQALSDFFGFLLTEEIEVPGVSSDALIRGRAPGALLG